MQGEGVCVQAQFEEEELRAAPGCLGGWEEGIPQLRPEQPLPAPAITKP